jgi:hypothetical protein
MAVTHYSPASQFYAQCRTHCEMPRVLAHYATRRIRKLAVPVRLLITAASHTTHYSGKMPRTRHRHSFWYRLPVTYTTGKFSFYVISSAEKLIRDAYIFSFDDWVFSHYWHKILFRFRILHVIDEPAIRIFKPLPGKFQKHWEYFLRLRKSFSRILPAGFAMYGHSSPLHISFYLIIRHSISSYRRYFDTEFHHFI